MPLHQEPLPEGAVLPPRGYAWIVFACTFGLLLSDYMSRQVLNAVFPLLKAEWGLSDTELGSLAGVVALMVGLLTVPLSVLADRWGRVRSIVLMAALWSLATLGCALAEGYGQMLLARFFVGIGEAAYGSVGVALILSIFPSHLRATLTGAFMAGGAFGSVLGMALGGAIAAKLGWRWSFGAMALFGFALVVLYMLLVSERRLSSAGPAPSRRAAGAGERSWQAALRPLVGSRSVLCAYAGSGLQLFVMASVIAWMPSFMNRYYGMPADRAGAAAAVFVLLGGAGMVLCGVVTDRVSRHDGARKWNSAIAYCLLACILLGAGFSLPPGPAQLALLGVGMLFAAGTSGPAGAMVANLTPAWCHGAAFAVLTLVNNLLGLAPGPFLTGALADRIGLAGALQLAPLLALGAGMLFALGRRNYAADLARLGVAADDQGAA
ncbi:MFS transporter [Pseudoduganella sp. OTU4001]|uniref:MFS transporter n=1 Tax=Pseudoduganella sp. OTU4001 TaxID=3043854 RepID=UPI00313C1B5B